MKTIRTGLSIALLASVSSAAWGQRAGATAFFDQDQFRNQALSVGKYLKGIETFEESNIGEGGKQALPDWLEPFTPNVVEGIGFPNGLAENNLMIMSNSLPGPTPPGLSPSPLNPFALYVIGQGFIGSNSKKVGEDLFLLNIHASLDLLFPALEKTAVGFWLSRFEHFPNDGWIVSVYDQNNAVIGVFDTGGPVPVEPSKFFFGVIANAGTISRINIYDKAGPAPDAIDDIEMWVIPEPASLTLLGAAAALALRRRQR